MTGHKLSLSAVDEPLQQAIAEWENILLPLRGGRDVLSSVLDAYAAPGRYYHTQRHIAEMTLTLAEYRGRLKEATDVFLACLWHDFIYDARRGDNEERSAEIWLTDADRLQLTDRQGQRVKELILATKKHQPADTSADMLFFLDADLAILGSGQRRYADYLHGIRYEYAHVAESEYRPGRITVLKKFLSRPTIYFTPELRERCESAARRSMQMEIEILSRADTFCGKFATNTAGELSYSIEGAAASFCGAFREYAETVFGFHYQSASTHNPIETTGQCTNGAVILDWAYDDVAGFVLSSRKTEGGHFVRQMGDFLNAKISGTDLNIHRHYAA